MLTATNNLFNLVLVQLHRRFLVRSAQYSPILQGPNITLYRYESYLQHSDPVVLALNPFFVLTTILHIPYWKKLASGAVTPLSRPH